MSLIQVEFALLLAMERDDEVTADRLRLEIARTLLVELRRLDASERRDRVERLADEETFSGSICRTVLERLTERQTAKAPPVSLNLVACR